MEEDVIEIYNNDTSPEVDFEINDVIYTCIPSGEIEEMKEDIAQNTADILLRALITETGNKIDLEINSSTFVMVAKLYDKNNNLLSTSSAIDLPLESMVVDAAYDAQTQEIVLTLKNGNTTRFSIADLVNGLASQDDVDALEERVDIVEDRMDVVEEIMPTVSATGTEITLQNTKKAGMKVALGGNTEQASTTGKNLWGGFAENYTVSGSVDFITYTNGDIYAKGTATSGTGNTTIANAVANGITKTLPAGTYVASRSSNEGKLQVYDTSANLLAASSETSVSFTLSQETTVIVRVFMDTGTSVDTTFKIMLEVGDTATDYEPYTGGTASPNPDYPQIIHTVTGNNTVTVAGVNYPINLGTIELCKIGDYQDRIFKAVDGDIYYDTFTAAQKAGLTYGKWYLHKEIDKVALDGSESDWKADNNNTLFGVILPNGKIFGTSTSEIAVGLCDKFIAQSFAYVKNHDGYFSFYKSGQNEYVWFNDKDLTLEQWKVWVSNNNITVYYPLETPTNTEITDTTLISQLEAIYLAKSAEGTTTITQTNADLGFMLTAIAFENIDMEGYVRDTDYATSDTGGVTKNGNGFTVTAGTGVPYCGKQTYEQYSSTSDNRFISKGTLENVITGKGLVSNTDYATSSTGGVVKLGNSFNVNASGIARADVRTYESYSNAGNNTFIAKGTLENVLAEYYKKQVVLTQAEYDQITPDANTLYIITGA